MQRRLTRTQRQAITKWLCLFVSASLFVGAFMGIPYLVKAIPRASPADFRVAMSNSEVIGEGMPVYALGAGSFEEESDPEPDSNGEYEPESPIPTPIPGDDDLPVFSNNLSWYEASDDATLNIINKTKYKVSLDTFLQKAFPIKDEIPDGEPLVLVIHTHGSESYLENGYDFYSSDETFRSLDESKTVVHIGELLCEKLDSLGIKTVHDKTMYDTTDFNRSYNYSREGIKKALEEYPTIKFVIDLHRDSVFDSSGKNIKPLTTLNGKPCAQLMLVVGTDEGGSNHPNWRDNLTFATHLQQKMNDLYPTLARPINLRSAAFNQALTKGSVILEVGSCGNTIEEAENAITLFAQVYAALIKENLK